MTRKIAKLRVASPRWRGWRQLEVLALQVAGRSNKEIAAALHCADNTVEFHVTQLLKKARVRGRGELIGRLWNVSARP